MDASKLKFENKMEGDYNVVFVRANPLTLYNLVNRQHVTIEKIKEAIIEEYRSLPDYLSIKILFQEVRVVLNPNLAKEVIKKGDITTPLADILAESIPEYPNNPEGNITFQVDLDLHMEQRINWGLPIMKRDSSDANPGLVNYTISVINNIPVSMTGEFDELIAADEFASRFVNDYFLNRILGFSIDEYHELKGALQERSALLVKQVALPNPIIGFITKILNHKDLKRIEELDWAKGEVLEFFKGNFDSYLDGRYEPTGTYLDYMLELSFSKFKEFDPQLPDSKHKALEGAMNMLANLIFAGLDTTLGVIKALINEIGNQELILENLVDEFRDVDVNKIDFFGLLQDSSVQFVNFKRFMSAGFNLHTSTPRIAREISENGKKVICLLDLQHLATREVFGEEIVDEAEQFRMMFSSYPDTLKISKETAISFGFYHNKFGCVGMNLALVEIMVLFASLFSRMGKEDLKLVVDNSNCEYSTNGTRQLYNLMLGLSKKVA